MTICQVPWRNTKQGKWFEKTTMGTGINFKKGFQDRPRYEGDRDQRLREEKE